MVRRVSGLQTSSGCRCHSVVSSRIRLVLVSLSIFLFTPLSFSQISLGLYEGLMGNSGTALTHSTAPSFYNPSLLHRKKKDSYSLSGNTLGGYSSRSENTNITSFSLTPSYLSTIIVGDALVHELFIANRNPSQLKIVSHTSTPTETTTRESTLDISNFLFGYSMSFKSVPFALSYFGEFNQTSGVGFVESTTLNSNARSVTEIKHNFMSIGTGISLSGHNSFDHYSLGYHFKSRQIILYKKDEDKLSTYVHGGNSATDYSKIESLATNQNQVSNGSSLMIGHGFQIGDHEFVTDTQFYESSALKYSYSTRQTFGYRLNSTQGHQFLCGLSHLLGPQVNYFGQDTYYSAGYSWLTRGLRSIFGTYVYSSKIGQDVFAAGLTFGSEFSY